MNLDTLGTGVPDRGKLGASKQELYALLAAIAVLLLIFASFWLESRP